VSFGPQDPFRVTTTPSKNTMWRHTAALLLVLAAGAVAEMDGIGTYYGGAPVRERLMGTERGECVSRPPHACGLAAASFGELESQKDRASRLAWQRPGLKGQT